MRTVMAIDTARLQLRPYSPEHLPAYRGYSESKSEESSGPPMVSEIPRPNEDGMVELGYGIVPSFQGQGYASGATTAPP